MILNRRSFIAVALSVSTAAVLSGQEKKETRWSGNVNEVDGSKKQIKMHTRQTPAVERTVLYDDTTAITLDGKPGKAEDAQRGYRIVARGTFEGNDLKATHIELFKR